MGLNALAPYKVTKIRPWHFGHVYLKCKVNLQRIGPKRNTMQYLHVF